MGSVIPLKKEIDNSYLRLKNLVGGKLEDVTQRIKYKLASEINLIHKMTRLPCKIWWKKNQTFVNLSFGKIMWIQRWK